MRVGETKMLDIKTKVARKSQNILQKILANSNLNPYVHGRSIPNVFMGADNPENVRLVLLGQDPTVKRLSSLKNITTVLNLDKQGSNLYKYISRICEILGLELNQHIYATNFAKNFFVSPPTQIEGRNILDEFSEYWLPLLREELAFSPGRPIITFGQPLLAVLTVNQRKALVRQYWDYKQDWRQNPATNFSSVAPDENKLGRRLFPFPHQPSLQKEFYRATIKSYINYVKNNMLRG